MQSAKVLGAAALGAAVLAVLLACPPSLLAQGLPPELTAPVNDFAGVIDRESESKLDALIRQLLAASGDTIVVATVDTFQPYPDLPSYAVKMFENHGKGVGQKGKDNGLLIVLAVKDRAVRVEVGYDLEGIITDGFAGETSRNTMVPYFRSGDYGGGIVAGATRIAERIAQARNVTLNVPQPAAPPQPASGPEVPWIFWVIGAMVIWNKLRRLFGPRGGRRRWSSHVGPFGPGFGGGSWGSGGGSFGGGFGGFGGGRSGGGGGGASW